MRRLTDEEWEAQFHTFERSAVHLELRDWYAVDEEKERFARFLATGRRDREVDAEERRPWLTLIRDATQAGKTVRRVRVVSEPVTDYVRFEWAGAGLTVEAGEDVRWLPRAQASGIAFPGNDFWSFDDSRVVFNLFTGDGRWVGADMTTDEAVVELCRSAFAAAWTIAVPHGAYTPV